MKACMIEGMTRDLNKPRDWDEERDGPCGSLPIRDEVFGGRVSIMFSEWKPSTEELALLNAGASVILGVCGTVHPPVSLGVKPLA
jgi:hypothetical protein